MKEWFYTVTQSMLELGLRGTELIVFAIINGYSQESDGCYYGSRRTLAERCGMSSVRTVDAALRSLLDKGFVKKCTITAFGQEKVGYAVETPVQNLHTPCNNCTPPVQNLHTPRAEFAPNNKVYNKDKNNNNPLYPPKGGFVAPAEEDVKAYCKEKGYTHVDAEAFIAFYQSKGWKVGTSPMKDWRAAVVTWEKRHKSEAAQSARPSGNYLPDSYTKYYE